MYNHWGYNLTNQMPVIALNYSISQNQEGRPVTRYFTGKIKAP